MSDQQQIISEADFAPILEARSSSLRECVAWMLGLETKQWSKKCFSSLRQLAHDLESFLDDFDARNNSTYTYFTELVASMRGFSTVAMTARHIQSRVHKYRVTVGEGSLSEFRAETVATLEFVNEALTALLSAFVQEAETIGLNPPEATLNLASDAEVAQQHLPHDLDEGEVLNEEEVVAQVATKFLHVREEFEAMSVREPMERASTARWMTTRLDEARAHELSAFLHGLQAKYDTFIHYTALETQHSKLVSFRGHISLALHLMEIVTDLVHFYERHENDIRWEPAKARIARLVDKVRVIDRIVNFGLFYTTATLDAGERLAEAVIGEFVQITEMTLPVPEGIILHARPLSLLVKIANHHGTAMEMRIGDQKCNAASIMNMIMLAGSHSGVREVTFHGDSKALRDVKMLFENSLGEGGLEDLPGDLDYLKG